MSFSRRHLHRWLDVCGGVLSLGCAIHCLFFPFLILVLPLLGLGLFLNETFEKVFVIASILLGSLTFCWGYSIHRKTRVLLLFSFSAIMILSGVFILPHTHQNYAFFSPPNADGHRSTNNNHSFSHDHNDHEHSVNMNKNKHRPQDNPLGLFLIITGGIAISTSHFLNRKLCKSCARCGKHGHTL